MNGCIPKQYSHKDEYTVKLGYSEYSHKELIHAYSKVRTIPLFKCEKKVNLSDIAKYIYEEFYHLTLAHCYIPVILYICVQKVTKE